MGSILVANEIDRVKARIEYIHTRFSEIAGEEAALKMERQRLEEEVKGINEALVGTITQARGVIESHE